MSVEQQYMHSCPGRSLQQLLDPLLLTAQCFRCAKCQASLTVSKCAVDSNGDLLCIRHLREAAQNAESMHGEGYRIWLDEKLELRKLPVAAWRTSFAFLLHRPLYVDRTSHTFLSTSLLMHLRGISSFDVCTPLPAYRYTYFGRFGRQFE